VVCSTIRKLTVQSILDEFGGTPERDRHVPHRAIRAGLQDADQRAELVDFRPSRQHVLDMYGPTWMKRQVRTHTMSEASRTPLAERGALGVSFNMHAGGDQHKKSFYPTRKPMQWTRTREAAGGDLKQRELLDDTWLFGAGELGARFPQVNSIRV